MPQTLILSWDGLSWIDKPGLSGVGKSAEPTINQYFDPAITRNRPLMQHQSAYPGVILVTCKCDSAHLQGNYLAIEFFSSAVRGI